MILLKTLNTTCNTIWALRQYQLPLPMAIGIKPWYNENNCGFSQIQ